MALNYRRLKSCFDSEIYEFGVQISKSNRKITQHVFVWKRNQKKKTNHKPSLVFCIQPLNALIATDGGEMFHHTQQRIIRIESNWIVVFLEPKQ